MYAKGTRYKSPTNHYKSPTNSRPINEPSSTNASSASMSAYDFLVKNTHRAGVLEMHLMCTEKKPIVYLDDEMGGATEFFLRRGVKKKNLIPVNYAKQAASVITCLHNVRAIHNDITAHMKTMEEDSCSVVWLDFMCRTVDPVAIRHALRIAPYVYITISSRGTDKHAQCNAIGVTVNKYGKFLERPCAYKGKSGIENMLKFVVSRKVAPVPCKHIEETVGVLPIHSHVQVWWPGNRAWFSACVVASNDRMVQVRYELDGIEMWHNTEDTCIREYQIPNDEDISGCVGTTVLLPMEVWNKYPTGYDSVKVVGKAFAFKVASTYHKKRFSVNAIDKRNRPMTRLEGWTLSYEQVCYYKKP